MVIDNATRRNLELTETMRDKQKWGSLLWVLDKTKTAMGARTLRSMTQQPLVNKDMIIERLDEFKILLLRIRFGYVIGLLKAGKQIKLLHRS